MASLAAALGTESLTNEVVRRLHADTGGHPLYLRTLLTEGSGFDPRAPGRPALPRSLAAAIADQLRGLPSQTRVILEMLAVLNLRVPLAQLGQAAQADSPAAAIEPAVAAGLVGRWPEEPACPVAIRHPLVRDTIYAGITITRRRQLHARAASFVSEAASGSIGWPPWISRKKTWRPSSSAWRAKRRPPAASAIASHAPAVGLGHLPGPRRPGTSPC